jgi:hypothetical protein
MSAVFDFLYREYCRARLTEMRKQLLVSPESQRSPEANGDANHASDSAGRDGGPGDDKAAKQHERHVH